MKKILDSDAPDLRALIYGYAKAIGSGGLVAYIAPQDLVAISDFYSVLVVTPASKYIKMHKIRAIEAYIRYRNELPGAQILDPDNQYAGDDIRLRSFVSERSIHIADLVALVQAQMNAGTNHRHILSKKEACDDVVHYQSRSSEILVGKAYYDVLLRSPKVKKFSGVADDFSEPTLSWRGLPLEEKGVFFLANHSLYGIVMPHAKTSSNGSKDRSYY